METKSKTITIITYKITIIFFLFVSIASKGQTYSTDKKVYLLDHELNEISEEKFTNRINSDLFSYVKLENDTIILKKLFLNEIFGKLDKKKHQQIKKLFALRNRIDSTKTWSINYKDTIPNKNDMSEQSAYIYLDSLNNKIGYLPYNSKKKKLKKFERKAFKVKRVIGYKNYLEEIGGDRKRSKKNKKVVFFSVYDINKGFPYQDLESRNYFNDPNKIIKKTFKSAFKNPSSIIIFPDGYYLIKYTGTYWRNQKKLKNNKSYFIENKIEWDKKIKNLK
ncbi:hypothetical protein ACSIGC_15075 [Tenacibaculum sp. ZS6-P6]|uniref:hypothetical protein n=1 Tax=Tenacibaculum sp. ZS6-P6 TaxID=3447503 RepID=UPI003F959D11